MHQERYIMNFNLYNEGSYTESTIYSRTIIASYSLPIALIDHASKTVMINLEAIEEFHSTTTSKHVNRAFITITETLDRAISELSYGNEPTAQTIELLEIYHLIDKAYKSKQGARLECLKIANDKGNPHFYTVYNSYELVHSFMNEGF